MNSVLTIWDPILTPIYIFLIYFFAYRIKATQIDKHPEYRYFIKGLSAKIFGGIAFALVYVYYYNGGDTHTYFLDSKVVTNMLFYKPAVGFSILADNLTPENYAHFNGNTHWPHLYIWDDHNTFTVVRYTVLFCIIGAKTYLPTTMLVSVFSYIGIWKLFQLFYSLYPKYSKYLYYSILLMPSFIFWGSGIMKDTYIIGSTCWMTYNFYKVFIERKKIPFNALLLVFNAITIIYIKPYVIASLIPSMLFWLNRAYIRQIGSKLIRMVLLPFIMIIFIVGGYYVFNSVGDSLGEYGNIDSAIEKAKITQQDLLREESYGSNSYDLGEIDGSFSGMLKLAPIAIFTALYRPFLNEVGGVMMLFSALENFVLLFSTIVILYRTKVRRIPGILKENPILLYSVVFSIFLAYGVGIATANFGALVRYKIPLIPFYYTTLFLIYKITMDKQEEKAEQAARLY